MLDTLNATTSEQWFPEGLINWPTFHLLSRGSRSPEPIVVPILSYGTARAFVSAEPLQHGGAVAPLLFATEATKARLRALRWLPDNHDGEGAKRADGSTVDEALRFLDQATISRHLSAGLNDDGEAVLQMDDPETGDLVELTFTREAQLDCYWRRPGVESVLVTGRLSDDQVRDFLAVRLGALL